MKKENEIRKGVRERYSHIASQTHSEVENCCIPTTGNSCCSAPESFDFQSLKLGYSSTELEQVPQGANLGLGCGNPQAIADIKPGETVIDLGSGAGFDAFLAARKVGKLGSVIGVDMTPEMVDKARLNAKKVTAKNVEFRLGEIEHLPVANNAADVIISNCVINLSPEKQQVFNEAFRVLKPGGRLAISDIVATKALAASVLQDLDLYCGCVSGASSIEEINGMLVRSGFIKIRIQPKEESQTFIKEWDVNNRFSDSIISATIEAIKP